MVLDAGPATGAVPRGTRAEWCKLAAARKDRGELTVCLGVPGKVLTIEDNDLGMTMGTVSFGGVKKEVCLAYVPEVKVGEYVIVHVGFAISRIDADEAQEVFRMLAEMGDLAELDAPGSEPETPS